MEQVFVNGSLMRGCALAHLLESATFLKSAETAPVYRLYSIDDVYPGMVLARPDQDGYPIEGELYEMTDDLWRRIDAGEKRLGLYRGPIWLADGRAALGMLCPRPRVEGLYPDISSFRSWKRYKASLSS
ncbi:MAG: gamma-glutamylcyclotransferase [Firmicutes bacterium]|nr:gamma-glutamylcyclotransferase [Bacillota bacterium]